MLQALTFDISATDATLKKGHLNLSVVTRPFSVSTYALVSKLPIELNHSNQMKVIQNLCKEEPDLMKGKYGVNMSLIEDDFCLIKFLHQSMFSLAEFLKLEQYLSLYMITR
jgi:hypothetical protein